MSLGKRKKVPPLEARALRPHPRPPPPIELSGVRNLLGNEVFLEEGLGRHVVGDDGRQVGQDRVHSMTRLLSGYP